MQVKIREMDGREMPEGRTWAVVRLDDEVWLLMARLDIPTLNRALAEAVA